MTAIVDYAPYAWCHDCAEGSDVGITVDEAKGWADGHNKANHGDDE